MNIQNIPLERIQPSLTNPRKRFDQTKLQELADSIGSHGVMQPIVVRIVNGEEVLANKTSLFDYEIVAGERRFRACKLAGVESIPAVVRELTDLQVLQLQVIENVQREDLHPLEEAYGYQAILKNKDEGAWNADQLAEKIGKSRTYIYNCLKLTELCTYVQDMLMDDKIKRETALLIARIPGIVLQTQACKHIIQQELSYRAARDFLQREYTVDLTKAVFKISDAKLLESAGSCKTCPSRSGNYPEIFSDIASPDVCTNPECYKQKVNAHLKRLSENGKQVFTGSKASDLLKNGSWNLGEGFVKIDAYCSQANDHYKKALGDSMPETAIIQDPKNGELIEVIKEKDAIQILKDKGVINGSSKSNAEKEREAQAKLERAKRAAMHDTVRETFKQKQSIRFINHHELSVIAAGFWMHTDFETKRQVAKIMRPGLSNGEYPDIAYEIGNSIPDMTEVDIFLLMMDLALVGQRQCDSYSFDRHPPTKLTGMLEHYGIDPEPIKLAAEQDFYAQKSKAPSKKSTEQPPTPMPAAQAQENTAQEKEPEGSDGHDWEGFPGGCARMGCASGCSAPEASSANETAPAKKLPPGFEKAKQTAERKRAKKQTNKASAKADSNQLATA